MKFQSIYDNYIDEDKEFAKPSHYIIFQQNCEILMLK